MNPASRRVGTTEFEELLPSLRDGSLWRACVELANIQCGLTYINFGKVFENVPLWAGRGPRYSRVRCPNLTLENACPKCFANPALHHFGPQDRRHPGLCRDSHLAVFFC